MKPLDRVRGSRGRPPYQVVLILSGGLGVESSALGGG